MRPKLQSPLWTLSLRSVVESRGLSCIRRRKFASARAESVKVAPYCSVAGFRDMCFNSSAWGSETCRGIGASRATIVTEVGGRADLAGGHFPMHARTSAHGYRLAQSVLNLAGAFWHSKNGSPGVDWSVAIMHAFKRAHCACKSPSCGKFA